MDIGELMAALTMWFGRSDHPAADSSTPKRRSEPQPSKPLCFVVDDETAVQEFISAVLGPMGLQIEGFGSAQSLLKGLDRHHPQLIFLDVSLEHSDGVEALSGLAERGYSGSVILMSGRHGQILKDIKRIGERHGLRMLPTLAKPFDIAKIERIAEANFARATKMARPVGIDEALQRGWMKVWYQPKIDLKRKILIGCEALARIQHPQQGILLPGRFLPRADAGALKRLTEHVLLTVLRDCVKFKEVGAVLRPSINVPVDVLLDLPLAALVRENRPKDEAWRGLIVEVTEDQIIRDMELAQDIATQLKIYDIALAIDDFGAGYSSFSRLKTLPFVELKLDMSFVKDCASNPQNAAICKAVIDLAHSFGSLALAEGIEQVEDLRAIFRMGCDLGQGFLLAAPMPVEKFIKVLEQRRGTQSASQPSSHVA